jgi:hypothetical protein
VHNIALLGKARAGKDTAAAWLVAHRAYTRLAFADPLKEMALRINPVVPTTAGVHVRLSALVRDVGWDYAKVKYPEVRRVLQAIGQTQREFDSDYWVNVARRSLNGAEKWNLPVVVTDVRYRNEAEMLKARGFRLVRIVRPGTGGDTHTSENELNDYPVEVTVINDGSVELFHHLISVL